MKHQLFDLQQQSSTIYFILTKDSFFHARLFLIKWVLLFVCTIIVFSCFLRAWAAQLFLCTIAPLIHEEVYCLYKPLETI